MREHYAIPADWSETDARDVLGVLYELEVRKIIDTSSYVMVSDVNTALISILSDGAYRGARITASSARVYLTDYAAHVLGTVSVIDHDEYQELKSQGYGLNDVLGKSGAEKAFETYLRGTDGKRMVSVNDAGKITGEYYSTAPQGGSTVELTLDLGLQKAVEDDLAATVSGMTAKDGIVRGAGAAVVGVGTGEVLALASYPTYHLATYKQDSNALNSDPAQPLFNRATSGTYAPGSTFKPCTAVAALEEGKITTSTTVNDTGKWVYPGYSDSYAWCWNHAGHGRLNVSQAITNSCNFFFAEMGYRLGTGQAQRVRLRLRSGPAHRHRDRRLRRLPGPGGRGPGPGPLGRLRPGQLSGHAPAAGQLYRHAGLRRQALRRPPAQNRQERGQQLRPLYGGRDALQHAGDPRLHPAGP
jgi:penicillin-binding protein 2